MGINKEDLRKSELLNGIVGIINRIIVDVINGDFNEASEKARVIKSSISLMEEQGIITGEEATALHDITQKLDQAIPLQNPMLVKEVKDALFKTMLDWYCKCSKS